MDIKVGDFVKLKTVKIVEVDTTGLYRFSLPSDMNHSSGTAYCYASDIETVVEQPLKPSDEVIRVNSNPVNSMKAQVVAVHHDRVWLSCDKTHWVAWAKDYRRV